MHRDREKTILRPQNELSRNHCRPQRIDIWQQAVDTDVFNPAFRSQEMRVRMSGGKPASVILTYVGRLGAGRAHRPVCPFGHACTALVGLHCHLHGHAGARGGCTPAISGAAVHAL